MIVSQRRARVLGDGGIVRKRPLPNRDLEEEAFITLR
jgi:hypothetical protein